MSLLTQVSTIDMSSGLPDGFSAGYQSTEIELVNLEAFAEAVEAAVAKAGLKADLNVAQIKGSRTRTDNTKVCRYSINIMALSGKTIGGVTVWDTGKVNWNGMSPTLVTPSTATPPTKSRRQKAAQEPQVEAAIV